MKKIYSLSILLLISIAVWSQKTWTGSSGNWNDGTKWTPNGAPTANSIIVFNAGAAVTITNVPTIQLNRITVTGGTDVILQGAANAVLTLNNVAGNTEFVIDAGSSLAIGTNVNLILGNGSAANIAGTFTIDNGRTYDTDNNNTVVASTGIINNFGIINSGNNDLSFAGGATYIHAQNGGVVPAATWDNNSNCNITGVTTTIPSPASFNQEFGNFMWDCPAQTGNLSFIGNLQNIDSNFVVANTGATGALNLAISGVNFTTTIGGDYIQTGGTLNLIGTSGTCNFELNGNFNMTNGTLRRGGGTCNFIFDGDTTQTFTKTGGIISGAINFSVNNNSAVDFGLSVLNGALATFTLNSGAKIITSHPNGLNSAGALGSIQTATRVFNVAADYEFRGPVTGIFNTGGSTNVQPSVVSNLIINNPSGSVTLSKPVTIANNAAGTQRLYLLNGTLITTALNILTLNDGVQAQYTPTSFVDGPLRKIGNDDFIFPVGKVGAGLHKIGIDFTSPPNNTTAFTAQYFRSNPQTLSTTLAAGLEKISACEYWTLNRTGTSPARVVLSWENNSGCGGQYVTDPDYSTLRVARLGAGNTWINEGNQLALRTGTTVAAGTITSANFVNTFSPFTLASSSALENPLPVVFGDVKAFEKNGTVQIEWSNLTEKDVVEYTIERSADGKDFTDIAKQWPTSNQNDKASYIGFDASPGTGANYYRIKVVETTGKIVYSKILSVNLGRADFGLQLYPNPVSGHQVTISLSNMKRGHYNLRVVNITGQDIFKKIIFNQSTSMTQTLDLPSTIKAGVYNLVISADGYRETKKFIVQ